MNETPGAEAIHARLEAAANKSGRAFDPKSLVVPSGNKKKSGLRVVPFR
jgi:hypothetical protein